MSIIMVLFVGVNMLCPYIYKTYIKRYCNIYGLETGLVGAIIFVESRYKADVKSYKGAVGLMQILPKTGESFYCGKQEEFNEKILYNPETNIEIGCRYLRYLFNKYYDFVTVLACYNAGEKNVLEWMGDNIKLEKTQIMFNETKNYIEKIERLQKIYDKLLN